MHIAVFDIEVHLSSCCPFTLLDTWSISEPNRRTDHHMAAFNLSDYDHSSFILTGIPGLEAAHSWISIPFFTFYIIGLLETSMVLFVVGKEETLHAPMYLLLCMLELTEISASTAIMPKALCIFWFNLKGITVGGCLTQLCFLQLIAVTHSAILTTMAFDRYVAICNPLRYATILTNARIAKLGLVCLTRAVLFILPLPLLLSKLPFCASRIIPHTYCDHMAVAKMSCGDITVNRIYILLVVFIIFGFDITHISVSYGLIIRAVLRIPSKEANKKALKTCTAHISVILISCTLALSSNLTHWFSQGITPYVHVILSNLYFILLPVLNPIVYGINTKELREKVCKYICRM
ncbi:unnamed protein product [Eretmochelys imbricata]